MENVVKTVVKRFIRTFCLMFLNSKEMLSGETHKTRKKYEDNF